MMRDAIKSEFEGQVIKEEYNDEISGSFIKTEVFVNQDEEDELKLEITYDNRVGDQAASICISNGPYNIVQNQKHKYLVLCLKNLTENEIRGYQEYIKCKVSYKCGKNDKNKKRGCKICGKLMNRRSMPNHINGHMGIRSYTCNICNKKFTWRSNLIGHQRVHEADTASSSHLCSKCDKTFKLKFNLEKHIWRVHTSFADSSKFQCDQCGKSFKFKHYLTKHINIVHLLIGVYSSTRTVCGVCNKSFSKNYIREHMKTHSGNRSTYPCDVCNQTFAKLECVRVHKMLVHSKINLEIFKDPVKCKFCFKLVKLSYLESHMKYHSGEKRFLCEICLKSSTSKTSLYDHNLKWHYEKEKPRPFSCSKCPKTFKHRINFERHEKFNLCQKNGSKKPTKKESYKCDICSKEFAHNETLKDHKKAHAGAVPKCQFCARKLTSRRSLKRHIIVLHSDELGLREENLDEKNEKEISDCILGL